MADASEASVLDDFTKDTLGAVEQIDDQLIELCEQLVSTLYSGPVSVVPQTIDATIQAAVEAHSSNKPIIGFIFLLFVLLSDYAARSPLVFLSSHNSLNALYKPSSTSNVTSNVESNITCPLMSVIMVHVIRLTTPEVETGEERSTVESNYNSENTRELYLLLQLIYLLCQAGQLTIAELSCFDHRAVNQLFSLIEKTTSSSLDHLNEALTKAILAINDQFLCYPTISNVVFTTLIALPNNKTFTQDLVFMLNRSTDPTVTLMILKLVYSILAHAASDQVDKDLFYVNDLRVLVDVVVRELHRSEEGSGLSHALLRVLHIVLQNEIIKEEKYKHTSIRQLCNDFITSSLTDRETVRLAERVTQELM